MPRSRLTGFEQVLLGMIFARPSTGYDLKRRFEHGLAVHRASLTWAEQAITRLTADSPRP